MGSQRLGGWPAYRSSEASPRVGAWAHALATPSAHQPTARHLAQPSRLRGPGGQHPNHAAKPERAAAPQSALECRLLPVFGTTCRTSRSHPANGPPTDDPKRPDRLPAIRPLTCTYLVAGAGFEPATSGL